MDVTGLTDFNTDLLTQVALAGGMVVGAASLALGFGFVVRWIRNVRNAGTKA